MMAVKGVGKRIEISDEDRVELERIVRASSSEVRVVERARIVLAAGEGLSTAQIAERVGCGERTVKKWRPRYGREGMAGLRDAPRSGRPLTHGPETRALLIAKACTRPEGEESGQRRERWTYRELGEEVGSVGVPGPRGSPACPDQAAPHRLLDHVGLLQQEGFEQRMGEVCELYVDPPENVLVVSIDEKTRIQAKAPGQTRPGTPGRPTGSPRA